LAFYFYFYQALTAFERCHLGVPDMRRKLVRIALVPGRIGHTAYTRIRSVPCRVWMNKATAPVHTVAKQNGGVSVSTDSSHIACKDMQILLSSKRKPFL
jgi:hypothetical protein